MANEIIVEVKMDDGSIKKGFINVEKNAKKSAAIVRSSFTRATSVITKSFTGLARGLTDLRTLALGVFAAMGTSRLVSAALDAAKTQEDAINALNTSLLNSGQFTNQASQELQAFASQLQQVTKFGDETTLQTMSLIQSIGQLDKEALKGATQAAQDMASALKIDLASAATLVGKAAAGEIGSLSRYGVIVKRGADNAETFANVLTTLQSKFGGAAQRELLTFSGATQSLSNAWGDLLEEFGFAITKSPVVVGLMTELRKTLEGVIEFFNTNQDALRGFFENSLKSLISFGIGVVKSVDEIVNVFYGLRQTVQRIFLGIETVFLKAVGTFKSVISLLKGEISSFSEGMKAFDETIQESFGEQLLKEDTANATLEKFNSFYTGLESRLDLFNSNLSMKSSVSSQVLQDQVQQMAVATQESVKLSEQAVNRINNLVNQSLIATISQGMQAVGKSLIEGGSAFQDFGYAVLGIMGDLAIQIGSELVAIGIGIDALKASLATLSGGVAIAAGLALIALGGLLKSLSGQGGTTTTSGVSAVSGTETGVSVTEGLSEVSSSDEKEPSVVVNIQGSVLDRKESGLELVKVLNQAFKDQGLKLQGAT